MSNPNHDNDEPSDQVNKINPTKEAKFIIPSHYDQKYKGNETLNSFNGADFHIPSNLAAIPVDFTASVASMNFLETLENECEIKLSKYAKEFKEI